MWGDAKVIFDALDELVRDIAIKSFSQYDNGVEDVLHDMVRFDLSFFYINIC